MIGDDEVAGYWLLEYGGDERMERRGGAANEEDRSSYPILLWIHFHGWCIYRREQKNFVWRNKMKDDNKRTNAIS